MSHSPLKIAKDHITRHCVACGSNNLLKSPAILMPFVAHRALGWQPLEIEESWGLRTIRSGMAYTVCNSLICSECELLFLDIRFSDTELASLYHDYRGDAYTKLREFYEPGYIARNDSLVSGIYYLPQVEEFLSPYFNFPIRMLDWGGDTGKNTPFKDRNQLFHIYDISDAPPVAGAKMVTKQELSQQHYDLLICSNVLEHIPYPADLLMEIHAAMQKETLLYLEFPYEKPLSNSTTSEEIFARKHHWHEHINFFSEPSARALIKACGFEVVAYNPLYDGTIYFLQFACRKA